MLAIVEKHRRQHIGSALLQQFLKEMRLQNIKHIELEVRIKNNEAVSFYKKYGFDVVGLIPNFYQNKEDAYLMRLVF
jgi:ribosomal-protein-alanine N-acetyltransferase